MKSIIVTADDLGLNHAINLGISEAYQNGIVTCAALLMNAPATPEGIEIAKQNPGLEVGIHLSIVEGFSLRGVKSTITQDIPYFESGVCLKKDWKEFIRSYFLKKIDLAELEEELNLQIVKFKSHFGSIPFLNSTQHLHLLPGIWKIVLRLCKTHEIKYIRLPGLSFPDKLWINKRVLFLLPFSALGSYCRFSLRNTDILSTHHSIGMQFSGKVNVNILKEILSHLKEGYSEIILHPGYRSQYLIDRLPRSYSGFDWENELKAATSSVIRTEMDRLNIRLVRFSDIKSGVS